MDFPTAHHNGKIYVCGGRNTQFKTFTDVYALDLTTMTWSRINPNSPASETPKTCEIPSSAMWNQNIVVYNGGPAVYLFDMSTHTWTKLQTSKPTAAMIRAAPYLAEIGSADDFSLAVWQDTLYVYGGHRRNTLHQFYNTIMACNLTTCKWNLEVTTTQHTWGFPYASECMQMWAADHKLFVFGGKVQRNVIEDVMLPEEEVFWSYDLVNKCWQNEVSVLTKPQSSSCPAGQ
jgi:N-acetylneuraminic acid mutarotase